MGRFPTDTASRASNPDPGRQTLDGFRLTLTLGAYGYGKPLTPWTLADQNRQWAFLMASAVFALNGPTS